MRIEEAVECMSKINLHRILDGYTKDTLKPDEATSRKRLVSDQEILSDPENIKKRMHFAGTSFEVKAVAYFLLEALLSAEQNRLDEQSIISYIIDYEKKIIEEAARPEVFKYKNAEAVNTYKTVLEVALEDDLISDDEKRLLDRLRRYVGLSFYDHHLSQAPLTQGAKRRFKFPVNMQSETHSPQLEVCRLSAAGLVSESDESNLPYGDSPWLAAGSFNKSPISVTGSYRGN